MKECICKLKRGRFNLLFNEEDNFDDFVQNFKNFNSFNKIAEAINFMENLEYHLEKNEWFKLELEQIDEKIKNHINKIINLFENSVDISHIEKSKLNEIKLIMYGAKRDDKWIINCQVIYPSKILKEDKKFLVWNNGIKIFKQENLVIMEDRIDFIFDEKTIYFKKLSDLNNIHGDFKHLYKEASKEEVKQIFVDELNDIISIDKNLIEDNKITSNNLKKIKFHKENGIFEEIKKRPKDFVNYLRKYPLLKNLVNENKIKISSDEDMKLLLKACSQQIYNGEFTKEPFLASGNKKIEV